MKIGIVGSRRRNKASDLQALITEFDKIYRLGDTIVSGGCRQGGDAFAEKIARARGISIAIHHADWSLGKHAGMLRNTTIAKDCDILIALVAADRTGGTEDTIEKAIARGKRVIEILCTNTTHTSLPG